MIKFKKYLILITSVICLFTVIFACFNLFFQSKSIAKEEIINTFINNQNRFISVQKYLEQSDDISYIYSSYGIIKFEKVGKDIDQKIYDDIKYLMSDLRVKSIQKDIESNITFSFGDESIGLSYLKVEINRQINQQVIFMKKS